MGDILGILAAFLIFYQIIRFVYGSNPVLGSSKIINLVL
jgi:hypothetical protein